MSFIGKLCCGEECRLAEEWTRQTAAAAGLDRGNSEALVSEMGEA